MLLCMLASGCGKRCDPAAFKARCDGNVMEFCQSGEKYGIDFGTKVARTPCTTNNSCNDFGDGRLGCAHAPLTPCGPSTFKPTCDGDTPLTCTTPSSFVTETWVFAIPCAEGQTCGGTQYGPECIKK